MENDAINYNDHDFPNPNSKLVPAGYQILKEKASRSRSLSPPIRPKFFHRRSLSEGASNIRTNAPLKTDRVNRKKIEWPRSGPLFVKIYPSRLIESTNVLHVNHLTEIIDNEKKLRPLVNVVMIADGGPDWSVKGIINFLSLGFFMAKC
jgi:hypothetical protein